MDTDLYKRVRAAADIGMEDLDSVITNLEAIKGKPHGEVLRFLITCRSMENAVLAFCNASGAPSHVTEALNLMLKAGLFSLTGRFVGLAGLRFADVEELEKLATDCVDRMTTEVNRAASNKGE